MDTILTVKNEDLTRLNSMEAIILFRELLWAEATRLGIPLSRINISTRINVPDGGVDASVSGDVSSVSNGLISTGHNSYQIKIGTSFQPSRKEVIKKELFGKKQIAKQNLGDSVRHCLDIDGAYILVCFGQDLIDKERIKAVELLKNNFIACGYNNPRVYVWSINNLISFIQPFPALALRINGRYLAQFQTFTEWTIQDDMQQEFVAGDKQEQLVSDIRTVLRRTDEPIHIRILGEAGIGKTRLVLEAMNTDDLQSLVIYSSDASNFRNSNLMSEIMRGNFTAILVIDECDPKNREYIWNILKNRSPRIKLVTLYNDYEDTSGINYIEVPLLKDEQIGEIIHGYSVPKERANRWAKECSGSPRVAHVIGLNLIFHPEDLLKSPATVNVWNRYIVGMDDERSPDVRQRRLVLQYLSLFKRFGYGTAVINEAKAVAHMVEQADPQVSWGRFQEIIKTLRSRKILQGVNTLYITPKLLHIRLWIDWWSTYGNDFDLDTIAAIPPPLLLWFFEMFEYTAGSEAATPFVRRLLGENGLFQLNDELFKTQLGAHFFRYLAKSEPESALRCLKKTLGTWSREQLLQFTTGRRDIIWALEGIAQWRTTFVDAARLLLALGEAENETWSNNASGVFAGLFTLSMHRQLSQTEASPEERFPVLKEALNTASAERRALALQACERALQRQHGGVITDTYRILGKEPELWIPQTWGELFDAYRQIWNYLYTSLENFPEDTRAGAVNVLLKNARTVGYYDNLSEMVVDTIHQLVKGGFLATEQVIEVVLQILHYDTKRISDSTRERWETLRDAIYGNDFHASLRRYVAMDLLEDKFDTDGNQIDQAEPRIEELAKRAAENHVLLQDELYWLVTDDAKNGFRFGYQLAQRDMGFSLLPMLIEAQKDANNSANLFFFGGYLRYVFEQNNQKWDKLLESFMLDNKTRLWVPELTWRSGSVSDKAAKRIMALVKEGTANIGHLRMFVYGAVIRGLSEATFNSWITFLLSHSEIASISVALELYSHYYINNTQSQLPNRLTFKLLTSPKLVQQSDLQRHDQMSSYNWELIGTTFVRMFPEDSLKLAGWMLHHFGKSGTIFDSYSSTHSVLTEIANYHPEEVWKLISKYIDFPIDSRGFSITHWLHGDELINSSGNGALSLFPRDVIWSWVEENTEKRPWYLATFVPKISFQGGSQDTSWVRDLLVRYGDREDVRNNLQANFSTEGWMGPESIHFESKRRGLLEIRDKEDNENVKLWIDEYVAELEAHIERAKIIEERLDY